MLYLIFVLIAGFIFLLSIIPKQKIFAGNILIQEYLDEYNETQKNVFLLSEEKLNIELIEKIIVETNQGFISIKSSSLNYTDTFIKISLKNIDTLKYPKNNVLIYANKTSILSFLFSNLF